MLLSISKMIRYFFLGLLLFTFFSFFAKANQDTTKVKTIIKKKDTIWAFNGDFLLLLNQSYFSNWASGGNSNVSGNISINYDINHFHNDWNWDTKILASFGVNKNFNTRFFRKNDDRLEINSLVGKKHSKYWNHAAFINFRTQFAVGYKYSKNDTNEEIRTATSDLFSPAFIQLGIGLYWKKSNSLWINMSPLAGKITLLSQRFTKSLDENETYFGVAKNKTNKLELGSSIFSFYKVEVLKNVLFENRLHLYADYLNEIGNVDIDYLLIINLNINDYLTTNITAQILYDHNAIAAIQFREALGLGITLSL